MSARYHKPFMIGLVIGKYRILEEIGRGAMGIVFKAQDEFMGRLVALKILAEKLAADPEMLSRFEREAGAASSLRHPNICTVFDSGNWNGRPYIAMELLAGETLDERLKRGALPAEQLAAIAAQVLSALEATHALGLVHRDIKPANLFWTTSGQVKLLDFGLAKRKLPAAPLGEDAPTVVMFATRQGTVVGTLAYMPPEQVLGEALDGRADLYSLGVTLYELATGTLPIRGAENMDAVPETLRPVLVKLMAADVRLRYQTAREVREAISASRMHGVAVSTVA